MSRVEIQLRQEVFDKLNETKGDNESWSGYLERMHDHRLAGAEPRTQPEDAGE